MTTLLFLLTIGAVAGAIMAAESRGGEYERPSRVAFGLLTWLTSGNWPAKIGAGLLVVGVGALLRFALKNLDIDPTLKLAGGIAISGLLAGAAVFAGNGPQRRAVSLALGGAAFGVAYLTAYSSFALFGYLDSETGTALLLLTAVGASIYAVTRSALSLAILSMFGAFLAPAFAVTDPGPTVVYGYYVVASLVTLGMVALRGWRPLIHLSFIFTLAGGAVFAWTSQYYGDAYASIMQPAVLALAAIHVVMPVFERRGASGIWLQRLDFAYILALPAVAALSAALLADSADRLSWTIGGLGVIWLLAAGTMRVTRSEGAAAHLVIGALLLGLAAAARFRDLPWELLALAFTVIALWMASRWSDSQRLQSILAGLVPLTGAIHMLTALAPVASATPFANERFAERAVGAALLILAGHVCRRTRSSLDTLLWGVGVAWAVIAVGLELVRADLLTIALVLHWVVIAATIVVAVAAAQRRALTSFIVFLPLALVFTASWANDIAPIGVAWASMFAATAALVWLGIAAPASDEEHRPAAIASIVLAALVAGIWGEQAVGSLVGERLHTASCVGAGVALLLVALGRIAHARSPLWADTVAHIFALAFAGVLLFSTTVDIDRSEPAIVLEILCVAGLWALFAPIGARLSVPSWVVPAAALGTMLWLQALLLRVLGPSGDLSFLSIDRVEQPAAISLLWAVSGAVLTFWGHRDRSRSAWIGGAALLVAATVKIVLFDIGSLGELSNILAVIAAGLVFLAVGWVAPMPPAATPPPKAPAETPPAPPPPPPPPSGREHPRDEPQREQAPTQGLDVPEPAPVEAAAAKPNVAPSGDYWQHAASRARRTRASTAERDAEPRRAWIIALVAVVLLALLSFGGEFLVWFGLATLRSMTVEEQSLPAPQAVDPRLTRRAAAQAADQERMRRAAEQARDLSRSASQSAIEAARRPQPQPVAAVPTETECQRWKAQLPAEYELVAGGAYHGKPLGFATEDPNREAGSFEVLVNMPDRDVVLLLGAYEPSVWTVRWTTGTRLAGVWLSGNGAQQVTGLLPQTPVLRTSRAGRRSNCPVFIVEQGDTAELASAAMTVLGRTPTRAVIAEDEGRIVFGRVTSMTPIEQGQVQLPASFRNVSVPLFGDAGLQELMARRVLRAATHADVREWEEFAQRTRAVTAGVQDFNGQPRRTFVVVGPMAFPGGLHGAHRATFIVARGVPRPTGDPGHSIVFAFE